MTRGFRYSRWDGTQVGFDLDADAVLSEMTDDLLYHGDLHAALRRMMQSGFRDRDGKRVQGMRELLEQVRKRRREQLDRYDLGGVYGEIAERLSEVLDQERAAIDQLQQEARDSGDERRREITEQVAAEKHIELDLLPSDLAGRIRALADYEFTSGEAREAFEALLEELKAQVAQSMFNQMSGAMDNMSAEDLARMKDMMAELNHMIDQRNQGEEPDFDGFMERFGDFFPENPRTLDELLEVMAQRMAAMQAMLNSMTPEQRAQLQDLANQLLEDMDLRWQVDQLSGNLRAAFPGMGWDRRHHFHGDNPMGLGDLGEVMNEMGELDQLENLMRSAANPGALAEVDIEAARRLLGDDAAHSLGQLAEMTRTLEEAGLVEHRDGRLEMTPRAIRKIGQNALGELFKRLDKDMLGRHEAARMGVGHERAYETRPYEFGDPFNLDIQQTVRNAIRRSGKGTPVRLLPEDFEVEQTEFVTRAATVVMLDVSLSMPMRENFLPAKKVAMAMHSLISSQFPRDFLGFVSFSRMAYEFRPEELPRVSWDFDYGTNMQHGLMLSRRMLERQTGTKQILMITDGEPTAHFEPGAAEPFFNYPPVRETVDATLREVNACTRAGIRINTFMLDADRGLKGFVEKLTKLNGGRAFFTTPDTLGDYVLIDFMEQRTSTRGAGRRSA
ncbi:MAG: hypothetical protein WA797_07465 [Acidimicrobiales bacterium]